PYPVTTGFTAGIAVVIVLLQLKDFLGLEVSTTTGHFLGQFMAILSAIPAFRLPDLAVGVLTLLVLWYWPLLKTRIPGHLVALAVASVVVWLAGRWIDGFHVATIGSRFAYISSGQIAGGLGFVWPWDLPNAEGTRSGLSLLMIHALIPSAFTIAMLGAIESLLCAVVADGMAGTRHDPDAELIGQGLGNIIGPFFAAIPATAAIARTATNIRAGGRTPLAALVHSLVILLVLFLLSRVLAYVPMASLAALLMLVAWNMSEAREFVHIVRISPRSDVAVLLTCFLFTVIFDMVTAVGVGLVLAALMFIHRMAELTATELLEHHEHEHLRDLPEHVVVYDIDGPLFFGAADKAIGALHHYQRNIKIIILDMTDVPMIDITGIVALRELVKTLRQDGIMVVFANLSGRIRQKLDRAGLKPAPGSLIYCRDMEEVRSIIKATATA
ncbi:MAG: SulP family inorganic anion transporter, partial [Gammaproteobacteria bacterium]